MKKATAILGAFGVGAGMMYFLDPDRGRRRRRLVRDKSLSAVKHIDDAIAKTSCDLSNRARGVVAEAGSVVSGQRVPDDILVARVESKIGRVVSHPGAIDVRAKDGRVTLRGPVLASEVNNLIGGVRSVRGVADVEDQLTVHKQAGDISALQGGVRGREQRFELLQENWSPTARLTMSLAGGALAVHGVRHRNAFCSALGFVGLGMFVRGITI